MEYKDGAIECPKCHRLSVYLIGCRTMKCSWTACRWTHVLPIIDNKFAPLPGEPKKDK